MPQTQFRIEQLISNELSNAETDKGNVGKSRSRKLPHVRKPLTIACFLQTILLLAILLPILPLPVLADSNSCEGLGNAGCGGAQSWEQEDRCYPHANSFIVTITEIIEVAGGPDTTVYEISVGGKGFMGA